jgi:hypothetical protein
MTRARPRRTCCAVAAALPSRVRASGRVAMRADAGCSAGALARAGHDENIGFAIGANKA